MKKKIKQIEDFIDGWCNTLEIPVLQLKIITEKEMENEINHSSGIIYCLGSISKNIAYAKYVIFHEIMRWYLYHQIIGAIYKNETIVEMITNELFKKYYPEYWRQLCLKKLI